MAISAALPRPGVHPWPMDTIPDPEVPERPTRRRFSPARAGRTGRRELPRPAYEAIRRTLGDCGKELATIAPDESLWQAGAGSRGITSGTFYAGFRRYLAAAGLAPRGVDRGGQRVPRPFEPGRDDGLLAAARGAGRYRVAGRRVGHRGVDATVPGVLGTLRRELGLPVESDERLTLVSIRPTLRSRRRDPVHGRATSTGRLGS